MRIGSGEADALLARMVEARNATLGHYRTIVTTIRARAAARAKEGSPKMGSGSANGPTAGDITDERYKGWVAQLTAPHLGELRALARRIARQNAAIARFCAKHGIQPPSRRPALSV